MNDLIPAPRKPKKYEYRGGTCPKHGNACAMRRCRLTLGPWECVECAHEAGSLQALPPASPPAPVPPTPTAEPADTAVEGRGAYRSWELMMQLEHAIGAWNEDKISDADLGIELLRISNELATESKRLRAAESAPKGLAAAFGKWPGDESEEQLSDAMRDAEVTPSGGAEALPSGWRDDGRIINHVSGAAVVPRDKARTKCHSFRPVDAQTANIVDEVERPLLQAMCAALGIELSSRPFAGGTIWVARHPSETYEIAYAVTADDACRDALERFHGRQQPAAPTDLTWLACSCGPFDAYGHRVVSRDCPLHARQQPAPAPAAECKCWQVSGKRIANRWCSLHASEWQTLAEQRSELHEDGTPRAGCGYCASTPELDARERGLAR